MSRKLTDAEFIERHRTGNRIRSERTRQRRYEAGKSALTVWIPDTLRTALTTKAANDGATISDTATALLSAALTPAIPDPSQQRFDVDTFQTSIPEPEPTTTTAERDQRIRELHKTGMNNCEIGRQIGCNEATVRRALKRETQP